MKSQEYPCSSCNTHCEGKLHFSFLLMSCTSKPQSPRHMNRRNLEFPFHPVLIAGANSGVPWIGRPPVFLENKFHWTSTPLLIVSPVHILAWWMWLLIKDLQMIMPSILHCTAAPQLKALEACGLGKYMGQASLDVTSLKKDGFLSQGDHTPISSINIMPIQNRWLQTHAQTRAPEVLNFSHLLQNPRKSRSSHLWGNETGCSELQPIK